MYLLKRGSTTLNTPPCYAPAKTELGNFRVKCRITSPIHLRMLLQSDFHEFLTMLCRIENLECRTCACLQLASPLFVLTRGCTIFQPEYHSLSDLGYTADHYQQDRS
jgi:hypothetical protein